MRALEKPGTHVSPLAVPKCSGEAGGGGGGGGGRVEGGGGAGVDAATAGLYFHV